MSSEGEQDDPIKAGSEIAFVGYYLSVDFYPQIKMQRTSAIDFARDVQSAMEVEGAALESNQWKFNGAGVCDGMSVVVERRSISFGVSPPGNNLEFYDHRFESILNAFQQAFSLEAMLNSNAMAQGLVPVSGDARVFLGAGIMLMHPQKLAAIDRSLHILGVRLYFPPDDVEWGVDVKVESWAEDTSMLFIEADADWRGARPFDGESIVKAVNGLSTVKDFMNTRLLAFLHQSPALGLDDENNQGGHNE